MLLRNPRSYGKVRLGQMYFTSMGRWEFVRTMPGWRSNSRLVRLSEHNPAKQQAVDPEQKTQNEG
jgi:hypothetical protein